MNICLSVLYKYLNSSSDCYEICYKDRLDLGEEDRLYFVAKKGKLEKKTYSPMFFYVGWKTKLPYTPYSLTKYVNIFTKSGAHFII